MTNAGASKTKQEVSGAALSQLISISLFLEGEGGWELAEQ